MSRLKSLEGVDWKSLKHAYGPAGDVPGQLLALLSPEVKKREKAHETLLFNVVHQGTRYQAAVPAVAVLVEMLGMPKVRDAGDIVNLLAYIAIGYDEGYLLSGFDPAWLDGPWPDKIDPNDPFDSGNCHADWQRFGMGPEVDYRCYWAVLEHMEGILAAFDAQPDWRGYLAYLLAWFPLAYPATARRLPLAGVSGILALGLLERQLGLAPTTAHLLGHSDLSVRTAAAIASAREPLDGAVERVLKEALGRLQDLQMILYNDGDWRGWICMLLSAFSEGDNLVLLLESLRDCNDFQALEVTASILRLVGHGPPEGSRRRALQAIHDGPGWGLVNYNLLMRDLGFPDTKADLRRWLDAE